MPFLRIDQDNLEENLANTERAVCNVSTRSTMQRPVIEGRGSILSPMNGAIVSLDGVERVSAPSALSPVSRSTFRPDGVWALSGTMVRASRR
ncbi:MAG: hypothetical protein R3C97_01885 [Geminicoccaceae bacterium]